MNFETDSWWDALLAAGFDTGAPSLVASTGVTQYITKEATAATLRQLASLAAGSIVAMTFMLPLDLVDEQDRMGYEFAINGARNSGTPFISLYSPDEMVALARSCGLGDVRYVRQSELARYFAGRADGLRPSTGEPLIVAKT